MARQLELPAELNIRTVRGLHAEFSAALDEGLELSAAKVRMVGGLGVQLLLAAKAECERRGAALTIVEPSEAFQECLRTLGADETFLREEIA